jgi:Flp pilus assembly protein TadG
MLVLAALALADAGSFLLARARAQAAADAAALAAVVEQVPVLSHGDDPWQAAAAEAGRNGAEMVACDCESGRFHATVTVVIRPRIALLHAWTGRTVRARARAEADPDLATYRR